MECWPTEEVEQRLSSTTGTGWAGSTITRPMTRFTLQPRPKLFLPFARGYDRLTLTVLRNSFPVDVRLKIVRSSRRLACCLRHQHGYLNRHRSRGKALTSIRKSGRSNQRSSRKPTMSGYEVCFRIACLPILKGQSGSAYLSRADWTQG